MNDRQSSGLTLNLAKSGLILGTGSSYSTTVTTNGAIGGKFVTTLAAQTNAALPIVDALLGVAFPALAPNQATVLLIGQTAAGVIKMVQGTIEATQVGITTTVGAFLKSPQFGYTPDDFMPLGYVLVRTAPSAASFIAGTSAWTAAGVTASAVVEISVLPDRPQFS